MMTNYNDKNMQYSMAIVINELNVLNTFLQQNSKLNIKKYR